MTEKKIQKHVYLEQENVDELDNLIKNNVGINTYSEAIRHIINAYSQQNIEEDSRTHQRKINAISKNMDILIEMVAGGFHDQEVRAIGQAEETYIYDDAKRIVESKIQKSTTMKSTERKKNSISPQPEAPKKESQKSYSQNFI